MVSASSPVVFAAAQHEEECSSPQASTLRQLRRNRVFLLGAAPASMPKQGAARPVLARNARALNRGGLPQEPAEGVAQGLLDCMAITEEDDICEKDDEQLYQRRRARDFEKAISIPEPIPQDRLDELCTVAEHDDGEEEESFHRKLRRTRAYCGKARAAAVQRAVLSEASTAESNASHSPSSTSQEKLDELCVAVDDDDVEEEEESFHLRLRRARAYQGDACAAAIQRAVLSDDSTAESNGSRSPSSSASESPSAAMLRVRRARAFEGPKRAAELVAELAARIEPGPELVMEPVSEPASPPKVTKSVSSPQTRLDQRILEVASPLRRRSSKDFASA